MRKFALEIIHQTSVLILTITSMKLKTIITELTHEDLVNLLCTATYGNESAVKIFVPDEFRGLMDKGPGSSVEDAWANVLLQGGQLDFVDIYDQSESEEESKLNRYGEQGVNWLNTQFKEYKHTLYCFGAPFRTSSVYYTAYRFSLFTLLNGLSCEEAQPYIQEMFVQENGDLYTAYNLMQIAIFGEIIYG